MPPDRLARLAAAPLAASVVVLGIAGVGPATWALQGVAVAVAATIAVAGHASCRRLGGPTAVVMAVGLALAGLALSLVAGMPPPRRWLLLGPVRLYVAPVVLPVLLIAWHASTHSTGRRRALADGAMVLAGIVLALQPDVSQVLALVAAVGVIGWRGNRGEWTTVPTVAGLALAAAWAFTRPDPLEPVPHVEGVMALAFAHSIAAGGLVAGGAAAVVTGLWRASRTGTSAALQGLAAYYAVLFACAHAGLTPAPLIGAGAGPWLGYGLIAAIPAADRSRPG